MSTIQTMQSVLIISKDRQKSEEHATKICGDLQIDNFDISITENTKNGSPDDKKKAKTTIGIEEIRNLKNKIFLKPLKSKNKAIIIKNSEDLTVEAQNALLKVLEEPPIDTIIILTARNKDLLLSTIISRCKIIDIKNQTTESLEKESAQYLDLLTSLPSNTVGERLKTAQDNSKTKEEAIFFLEKMILLARHELLDRVIDNQSKTLPAKSHRERSGFAGRDPAPLDNLKDILISFNNAYTIVKTTNVNPRLALENLLLNL